MKRSMLLALAVVALAAFAPQAKACGYGGYAGAAFIAPVYSYAFTYPIPVPIQPATLVQPVTDQTYVQPFVGGYGYGAVRGFSSGYGYGGVAGVREVRVIRRRPVVVVERRVIRRR